MLFEKIVQRFFFGAMYLFFKKACKGEIVGSENVEACLSSGFVLVANHSSYLDSIVIWSYLHYKYGINTIFFAKDKLFKNALFGPCIRALSYVKVSDNGDAVLDKKTYRKMLRGKNIGIFPEGSRTKDGTMIAHKYGAAVIADKLNLPILPVALCGFYNAWPRERLFPCPAKCKMVLLKPVWENGPVGLDRAMEQIKSRVTGKQ